MPTAKRKPASGVTIRHPNRKAGAASRQFEDVFGRNYLPATWRGLNTEDEMWAPVIDVIEKEDQFLLKVELPGVKEEDINISISGNILSVEGEKKTETEIKKKDYYYSESSYGSFARSVTIPSTVDVARIEANCDTGVLLITLPKTTAVKSKKIAVAPKKNAEAARTKKEQAGKKQQKPASA